MRGVQGVGDLHRQKDGLVRIQRAREPASFEVFHDEVALADVVQRADMRMIQRGNRAGLVVERRVVFVQPLDRDRSSQARVLRLPDLAHAAGADRRDQRVRTNARTRFPRHPPEF